MKKNKLLIIVNLIFALTSCSASVNNENYDSKDYSVEYAEDELEKSNDEQFLTGTKFYFDIYSPDINKLREEKSIESEEKARISVDDLEIYINLVGTEKNWDTEIMNEISHKPIIDIGFIPRADSRKWEVEIKNIGEYVLNNVKLKYKIIAYKYDIEFDESTATVLSNDLVVFKELIGEMTIENIAPETFENETIFYMGTFPYVEIEIEEVLVDGMDKDISVKVENEYFGFEWLSDMQDTLVMYGIVAPYLNIPQEVQNDKNKIYILKTEVFDSMDIAQIYFRELEDLGIEELKIIEGKNGDIAIEVGCFENVYDVQIVFSEIFKELEGPRVEFYVEVLYK